ncbi:hypothetical protein [Rhizobium leguminosarum]|uniref:hypothetical protein n=1 Tax=Rhizobium TaxID=379 RepID=UPI0013F46EE3|nr:hypothetical protein [Rhizobium leguminosarum]QIO56179.1 hypothetical protein HA463_05935 [Rhizobium leguminosarum bv. trifolii]
MGCRSGKRRSLRQFRPSFCNKEAFRFGSEVAHLFTGLVGRCHDNVALTASHDENPPTINALISFGSTKTPAGGGSGGRVMVTDNWEEECCQSIATRWEEECAAANLVTDKASAGIRLEPGRHPRASMF